MACSASPPAAAATSDPPPLETNPSLVGPAQLLKSAQVEVAKGTVTLPLYRGTMAGTGKTVWYILTEASDLEVTSLLGLSFSAKLNFVADGARSATFDADSNLVFDRGAVDFKPDRRVTPGPASAPFPPAAAQPGSVGDQLDLPSRACRQH